jgi:integrase
MSRDPLCIAQQMVGFDGLIPRIPTQKQRVWIPTPELMKKFWMQFRQSKLIWDFRDFVVTAVMLDCGVRSGEIRYMKTGHFKLETRMLLIPEEGKTGARPVNIRVETAALIEQWLRVRGTEPGKAGGDRRLDAAHCAPLLRNPLPREWWFVGEPQSHHGTHQFRDAQAVPEPRRVTGQHQSGARQGRPMAGLMNNVLLDGEKVKRKRKII